MPEKLSPLQGLKIEEFTQNLYSCPYAILITRLSDGLILYVNRGFEEIFGYPSSEAVGKNTLDLRLWVNDADRQQVIAWLSATGEVQSKKFQFRKYSGVGGELTGLFFAKILDIENDRLVLSSISDIPERKPDDPAILSLASFPTENPEPILRIGQDGCLLFANQAAFLQLIDWKLEPGKPVPQNLVCSTRAAFETQTSKTIEIACGKSIFSIIIVPAPREEYVNLYGHNITKRKLTEDELLHNMEELKNSNAELEQFAYVASHDLKEPLRMVTSYVQLLERRYKGKLDLDADECIGFIVEGAKRMQKLINDLLSFSQVGTRTQPFTLTSCDTALAQAVDNLQVAIRDNKAKITHDPLPEVLADEVQLVQLFQNLVGNAIKFHGDEAPQVCISVDEHEQEWVFSVRDNGIGFDPQYAQQIFTIFQRLHDRSHFDGNGIGLAICKKIVQRHDGRIWVESQPGKGATFFFTLPKRGGK